MGLLDILNGMQNGPRGPSGAPADTTSAGKNEGNNEGMSPITMAILAMLAYKAVKHFGGGNDAKTGTPAGNAATPIPSPSQAQTIPASTGGGALGGALGGGLGDLLKGGLGGLLAGGAAGSILSGGIGDLLKQLQQSGHADAADSWVGNGDNKAIAPNDLAAALGADQINALTAQTGMSRDELLAELSEHLPDAVSQFTPDGHAPSEKDLSRWF